MMEIRPFAPADEDAVVDLWERCALTRPWNDPRKDIQRKLTTQAELFLVGNLEGSIVATVMAGYDGHRAWLYLVAVAPEHRKLGIGRRLVLDAVARLRRLGASKLNLQINTDNAGVVGFYEKLGFRVEPRVSMGLLLEEERA